MIRLLRQSSGVSISRPVNWTRVLYSTKTPDIGTHAEQELTEEDRSFSPKGDKKEWDLLNETARKETAKTDRQLPSQKNRTEVREEMYFRDIFHSILDPGEKPASETVLQVFDRKGGSDGASDLLKSILESRPQTKKHTSDEDFTIQLGLGNLVEHRDVLQKAEEVNTFLEPVLTHITKNIESNQGITDYYKKVILPRFNPQSSPDWKTLPSSVEEPLVCPETIPALLTACIRTLRTDFSDTMGALHLFEYSKRHSVEVFANACTADAYNQIIELRWNDYRDLYAVLNLAAEIAINAIRPNVDTIRVLSTVYREATDNSRKLTASESLPLWTKEDNRRLRELNRYRSRFQQAWSGHMPL